MWAVSLGRESTARILLESGADVDLSDNDGRTPLFWAAECDDMGIVRLLLHHGVHPMCPSFDGLYTFQLFGRAAGCEEAIAREYCNWRLAANAEAIRHF